MAVRAGRSKVVAKPIAECPRCGAAHEGMEGTPLARPIDSPYGGPPYTHSVVCPTTGEKMVGRLLPRDDVS